MNTKGWDTISMIKQEKINQNWSQNWHQVNAAFNEQMAAGVQVIGEFDSWQVVEGGGGRLLRLELPVKSGKLVLEDREISLAGIKAVIEITLSLMPQNSEVTILKTVYQKIAHTRAEINDEESGWILPITVVDKEGKLGIYSTIFLDSICQYLLEHPKQFEMIFAEIDQVQSGAPSWALPVKCAYTYLDTGYLAILAVCTEREICNLPLDVDMTGITLDKESFFILSREMVLSHLVLPGLIKIYQSCSTNDFELCEGKLTNKKRLSMKEIKSGAIYYTPEVYERENVASMVGSQIDIRYKGECNLYAGIKMYWNGTVSMKLALEENNTVISFYKDDSNFNHDEDIPWYLKWLILIVGAIVSIVVAVISDDLIDNIKNLSSNIKADQLDTVSWKNTTQTISSAYLCEALIITYH